MLAPIDVILDLDNYQEVYCEAHRRTRDSEARRLEQAAGYDGPRLIPDLKGCFGECAWCKGMGLPWLKQVGTFKLPDWGRTIQIRAAESWGNLIFRPRDKPHEDFTLVCGEYPTFTIWGWMEGYKICVDQFLDARPANGRPAYWKYPALELHKDMDELLRRQ